METSSTQPINYIESSELEEINLFIRNKCVSMNMLNGRIELFDYADFTEESDKVPEVIISDSMSHDISMMPAPITRKRSGSVGSHISRRPRRSRSSSLGDLDETSSHKILLNLVASMSEMFPDY